MLPIGLVHYHWKLMVYIYKWKKTLPKSQVLPSCKDLIIGVLYRAFFFPVIFLGCGGVSCFPLKMTMRDTIHYSQPLDYSGNNTKTFWTDSLLLLVNIHVRDDTELYHHFSCSEYLMDSLHWFVFLPNNPNTASNWLRISCIYVITSESNEVIRIWTFLRLSLTNAWTT